MAMAAAFLSTASGAEPSTKEEVISLIELREVPLTEALRQLARQARLNVILDPRLSEAPYSNMTVSVRWEKVTAQEALAALMDNYGLVLGESSRAPAR